MTDTTEEELALAFIASEEDPQRRQEAALEIIGDLRRITFKRLASASREKNKILFEALEGEQKKYDDELDLIYKADGAAVERALSEHARILRQYNKTLRDEKRLPNLNDGPR